MDIEFGSYEHEGATLIPFEDITSLNLPITQMHELNEAESNNINRARERWIKLKRLPNYTELLTLNYANGLHRECYGEVWSWAGMPRSLMTNIGVAPYLIQQQLKQLLDNTKYKIDALLKPGESAFAKGLINSVDNSPVDRRGKAHLKHDLKGELELILVEFAYKLVWIHPFTNGNGRWSRVYTDQLADVLNLPRFSWGISISYVPERRNAMINSLRIADMTGDLSAYLSWAKK
jgi:fido (protein-threonine AMPylation protein)